MRGTRKTTRMAPTGGWDVGCRCGWDGGNWPSSDPARRAYRKHLDAVIGGPRRCKRCGEEKPAAEFADRYSRHVCKVCYSDAGNAWQRDHPEEAARHKRNHHLLMKFGITADEADALLAEQGGVCPICREEISDARGYEPHIDHDHETGQVRGILCFLCNAGLGQFRDNPDRLRAAIVYLERAR